MATIKLTKKITVLGNEIDSIELREPTTRDVRKLGMPIAFDGKTNTASMDMDICAKYLVALSNLTDGDIDKLAIDDFVNAATMVVTFFNPAMPEKPSIS